MDKVVRKRRNLSTNKHHDEKAVTQDASTAEAKRMLYFVYNNEDAPAGGNFSFDLGNVNMSRVYTRLDVVDMSMAG